MRQIDVRQLVGNPATFGKHLSRHERDLVVAQIELKNKCKIMLVKINQNFKTANTSTQRNHHFSSVVVVLNKNVFVKHKEVVN